MSGKVKVKKPFYKKWWFILIAAFFILGAIGSALDDGESTEEAKVETSAPVKEVKSEDKEKEEPAKEEVKEEVKEEPVEEVIGIGTPLNVGKAIFTLNGTEIANQVGPSVLPSKASGKYLVLDVTYKNNGNEAVTLDSSFFKLKRGEKTYEADTMASMSANQGEDGNIDNSFFLQQVNPDIEINGKVVFDLAPEVAEATDLQLQVQTGLFGTETGIINIK